MRKQSGSWASLAYRVQSIGEQVAKGNMVVVLQTANPESIRSAGPPRPSWVNEGPTQTNKQGKLTKQTSTKSAISCRAQGLKPSTWSGNSSPYRSHPIVFLTYIFLAFILSWTRYYWVWDQLLSKQLWFQQAPVQALSHALPQIHGQYIWLCIYTGMRQCSPSPSKIHTLSW